MRKYNDEIVLPQGIMAALQASPLLNPLGSYHLGTHTLTLSRGNGFFVLFSVPDPKVDDDPSFEYWDATEIQDLKDHLVSELDDLKMLGISPKALQNILKAVNLADPTSPPRQLTDGVEMWP